jgi:hypothetical protein
MARDHTLDDRELARITLEYFANPTYREDLGPREPCDREGRRRDARFYRKRISELTRRLLRGETAGEALQTQFDGYVDAAVAYFKMMDRQDILQKEYAGLDTRAAQQEAPTNENDILERANSELVRVPQAAPTLDAFVVSSDTPANRAEAPQIRQVNLRDPQLRTKGLRAKRTRSKKEPRPED